MVMMVKVMVMVMVMMIVVMMAGREQGYDISVHLFSAVSFVRPLGWSTTQHHTE
jgi:ABC-type molybdate transport system substrate-binding protein